MNLLIFNSKCYCLQKQLELIKTNILYYLQISMNTYFHYLNGKKNPKPKHRGCFLLSFGQASSRMQEIRNQKIASLWKHKDQIFLVWLRISNYCCHFLRPFTGQHTHIRKKILMVEVTTILKRTITDLKENQNQLISFVLNDRTRGNNSSCSRVH